MTVLWLIFTAMCVSTIGSWAILAIGSRITRALRREDADYDAHRTPGLGEPGGPFLFDSPEFRDQVNAYCGSLIAAIDAEWARRAADEAAELDDDAAVAAWLGGGGVSGHTAEIDALDTIARWAIRHDVDADRLQETPEFLRGYRAALDDLRAHLALRRQRVLPPGVEATP